VDSKKVDLMEFENRLVINKGQGESGVGRCRGRVKEKD
jgi:hypothetical protein